MFQRMGQTGKLLLHHNGSDDSFHFDYARGLYIYLLFPFDYNFTRLRSALIERNKTLCSCLEISEAYQSSLSDVLWVTLAHVAERIKQHFKNCMCGQTCVMQLILFPVENQIQYIENNRYISNSVVKSLQCNSKYIVINRKKYKTVIVQIAPYSDVSMETDGLDCMSRTMNFLFQFSSYKMDVF